MADQKPIKLTSTGKLARFESGDVVAEEHGGTGESSFTQGDLLVGNGSGGLTKLTLGSSGQALTSNGTTAAWADITGTETQTLTNDDSTTVAKGRAVYTFATGSFKRAQANASGTAQVIGLAIDSIASSASGRVQTAGVVTLSTGEWDVVTGGSGGLTAGSVYFLSAATAGALTATAPTSTGNELFRIGTAISTTKLKLDFFGPVTA